MCNYKISDLAINIPYTTFNSFAAKFKNVVWNNVHIQYYVTFWKTYTRIDFSRLSKGVACSQKAGYSCKYLGVGE